MRSCEGDGKGGGRVLESPPFQRDSFEMNSFFSLSRALPLRGSFQDQLHTFYFCLSAPKQGMGFCKSFLEPDCFDTVVFSISPEQTSLPFRLFHSEMIPFSNSVLDTTQRHCNPHWLLGKEEVKKKTLLKIDCKLYLKQFSEKQWLRRLWARTAGRKPSHFSFKAQLPVAVSRPHIS